MTRCSVTLAILCGFLGACGDDDGGAIDAAAVIDAAAIHDAATIDADTVNDASPDAPSADARVTDASFIDATMVDAALIDAALIDAAITDAAVPDAAVPDAMLPDAPVPDAALPDATPPNNGVKINEFRPKGTEAVELYHIDPLPLSITGWYLTDTSCGSPGSVIGSQTIAGGGFFVVNAGDPGDNFSLSNAGDVLILCDHLDAEVDRVAYGNAGPAPLAPTGYTVARRTDGDDGSGSDAVYWNLDGTPTLGASNDPPTTNLGSSILINEIDTVTAGNDRIELYNPTGGTVNLTGWAISDGDAYAPLVGTLSIAPGGFIVLEESVDWTTAMDFASTDVAYLFDANGVRLDQIGWDGETEDDCFSRSPAGAGPNDGYDWISSGGGTTWIDTTCTLSP